MLDWFQNVSLQVNTTQFLQFKKGYLPDTAQKMEKSLMENYIFCAVWQQVKMIHFNKLSTFEI